MSEVSSMRYDSPWKKVVVRTIDGRPCLDGQIVSEEVVEQLATQQKNIGNRLENNLISQEAMERCETVADMVLRSTVSIDSINGLYR